MNERNEYKIKKKHLGIDVDGVMTNMQDYVFEYAAKFAYERGYELTDLKKEFYYTEQIYGWDKEMDKEFWVQIIEDYSKFERPRPFTAEIIQKLQEKGWKIHIITARGSFKEGDKDKVLLEKFLEKWLEEHNIPYEHIEFTGSDKSEALKKYEIDVMIEDHPRNAEELKKYAKIILFDAMYNKECVSEDLIRVNSWYEILYHIEELEKNNEI